MVFLMEFLWAIVFAVGVIVEIITVGLTTIWFAVGALVAFIAAVLGAGVRLQVLLFIITTFATLFWTRPLAVKYLNTRRFKTNIDETIGSRVRVIERVDNGAGTGKVNYNGMEWTARSVRDEVTFEVGDFARVERIEGVKMIIDSESNSVKYTEAHTDTDVISNDVVLTAEENA